MIKANLLIVDQDRMHSVSLTGLLVAESYKVQCVPSLEEARITGAEFFPMGAEVRI